MLFLPDTVHCGSLIEDNQIFCGTILTRNNSEIPINITSQILIRDVLGRYRSLNERLWSLSKKASGITSR